MSSTSIVLNTFGFFPTPARVRQRMMELIEVRQGDVLLEPSAGLGHIARQLRERYPDNPLHVIERDPAMVNHLILEGFQVVGRDFLSYRGKADVIMMNPPFGKGFIDLDHYWHAWTCLNPGGRLISVLHEASVYPVYTTGRPVNFARWLMAHGGGRERCEDGAFLYSDRPSSVPTALAWVTKPL